MGRTNEEFLKVDIIIRSPSYTIPVEVKYRGVADLARKFNRQDAEPMAMAAQAGCVVSVNRLSGFARCFGLPSGKQLLDWPRLRSGYFDLASTRDGLLVALDNHRQRVARITVRQQRNINQGPHRGAEL